MDKAEQAKCAPSKTAMPHTKRRTAAGFSKAPGAGVVLFYLIFAQNFHFVQFFVKVQKNRGCIFGCCFLRFLLFPVDEFDLGLEKKWRNRYNGLG